MKIFNSVIKSVTVGFNCDNNLCVNIDFFSQYGCVRTDFKLTELADVYRITKLMNYAGANTFDELKYRTVRVIYNKGIFSAFGHPICDKFVSILTNDFEEFNESQIKGKLK